MLPVSRQNFPDNAKKWKVSTPNTIHSGLNGHKFGCPNPRKWESLLCWKNLGFELAPIVADNVRNFLKISSPLGVILYLLI